MFDALRPLLFRLDPERAHALTIAALRAGLGPHAASDPPALGVRLAGIALPNPVGLAAGFDKNADVADAMLRLGFGFVETGTVTPQPQPGNPRPRLFRLPEDEAVINRLGFNNAGLARHAARLARRAGRPGVVGVNIGANKDSADRIADYVAGTQAVRSVADYITVNISSPNTQNLRALQSDEALDALLGALSERDAALANRHGRKVPMFVKIAPDLVEDQVRVIAATLKHHGISGVIATNTTISRESVKHLPNAGEAGGLSGAPVFEASNAVIRQLRAELGAGYPIIGVGGVMSGADAIAKVTAGADLVQLYTGFIYKGPELVTEAAQALKGHASR